MAERNQSLHILQHSLGLDDYGRDSRGRVPADLEEPYRNRFVTGDGSKDWTLCMAHVEAGRMKRYGPSPMFGGRDGYCFCVTESGFSYVIEHSPKPPKVSRGKQRYAEFLNVRDARPDLTFGEWLKAQKADANG